MALFFILSRVNEFAEPNKPLIYSDVVFGTHLYIFDLLESTIILKYAFNLCSEWTAVPTYLNLLL